MEQLKNKEKELEQLKKLWAKAFIKDKSFNFPRRMPKLKKLAEVFSQEFLSGKIKPGNNVGLIIKDRIVKIQAAINQQLNAIFHHPQFQKMEATWRGLRFLVTTSYIRDANIKIRSLDISKKEMILNFERSIDFDRSVLFKLIYEKEYGTYGGSPYSFLVGDYEFSRSNQDLFLLENISHVAAAAHAPFLSAINPPFLDLNSFVELGIPRNIDIIFRGKEMIKWASFRKSEDSRYVTLALPHILLRLPYGSERTRVPSPSFHFEEDVSGALPNKYLWGNAAYALAQRICKSFYKHGWLARFYGIDGSDSGKVENLPIPKFDTLPISKMSTDVYILDSLEKKLSTQGLVCLRHCKMTDYSAFINVPVTAHLPKKHGKRQKSSNDNERLSVTLPHILTASRFAHYFKSMIRDKLGVFTNRLDLENYLNNWLGQYVLSQTNINHQLKARYPLKEGRVDVFEDFSKPGGFKMVAYLRPHFQLEYLNATVRFVASLPTSADASYTPAMEA